METIKPKSKVIDVNHVNSGYAWAICGTCRNTVKFDPQRLLHTVCAGCGSVWQLQGDQAILDDDEKPITA